VTAITINRTRTSASSTSTPSYARSRPASPRTRCEGPAALSRASDDSLYGRHGGRRVGAGRTWTGRCARIPAATADVRGRGTHRDAGCRHHRQHLGIRAAMRDITKPTGGRPRAAASRERSQHCTDNIEILDSQGASSTSIAAFEARNPASGSPDIRGSRPEALTDFARPRTARGHDPHGLPAPAVPGRDAESPMGAGRGDARGGESPSRRMRDEPRPDQRATSSSSATPRTGAGSRYQPASGRSSSSSGLLADASAPRAQRGRYSPSADNLRFLREVFGELDRLLTEFAEPRPAAMAGATPRRSPAACRAPTWSSCSVRIARRARPVRRTAITAWRHRAGHARTCPNASRAKITVEPEIARSRKPSRSAPTSGCRWPRSGRPSTRRCRRALACPATSAWCSLGMLVTRPTPSPDEPLRHPRQGA